MTDMSSSEILQDLYPFMSSRGMADLKRNDRPINQTSGHADTSVAVAKLPALHADEAQSKKTT